MQNSPRLLLPLAIMSALNALIDDEGLDPSARRVELRVLRNRLARAYRLPVPDGHANATEVAQGVADDDGEEIRTEV